jgi:hypothetical protein
VQYDWAELKEILDLREVPVCRLVEDADSCRLAGNDFNGTGRYEI